MRKEIVALLQILNFSTEPKSLLEESPDFYNGLYSVVMLAHPFQLQMKKQSAVVLYISILQEVGGGAWGDHSDVETNF